MSKKRKESVEFGNEIVFCIVAPVGVNIDEFVECLKESAERFKYSANVIRATDILNAFIKESDGAEGEAKRRDRLIRGANDLRRQTEENAIMMYLAVSDIFKLRSTSKEGKKATILPRTIHIIRSAKHPEEVRFLRRIYGSGFFLIGLSASEESRYDYLVKTKRLKKSEAAALIERDADEGLEYGQKTRDAFYLSDVFIQDSPRASMRRETERFMELVFNHPYHTPRRDEHAMFMAYSASLRSGDLSRQVGAAIVNAEGELIAMGCNEVPCFGGGQYWAQPEGESGNDHRDYVKGFDSNKAQREMIYEDIRQRLDQDENIRKWLGRSKISAQHIVEVIAKSKIRDITEYGRPVHAEMAALLSCARISVSAQGGTLYTTTFPCHNCAKHIVAAGIRKVVFVEPYPKSLALDLHSDAIAKEGLAEDDKMLILPYVGVGPRRFLDLFSLTLSDGYPKERNINGKILNFEANLHKCTPRLELIAESYLESEERIAKTLKKRLKAVKKL